MSYQGYAQIVIFEKAPIYILQQQVRKNFAYQNVIRITIVQHLAF